MKTKISSVFRKLVLSIFITALFASVGCEYSNLDDVQNAPVPAPAPAPAPGNNDDDNDNTPDDDSDNDVPSGGGDQRFLWKPVSENNGKLVVLLPARLTGKVNQGSVTVNGESGNYSGVHNGGREHYRYSKPGGSYDAPAKINASLKAGGSESWTVTSPSSRTTL